MNCSKNINAKCFACEHWVKRVGIFGAGCIVTNDLKLLFCIFLNSILVILSDTKILCKLFCSYVILEDFRV